MAIRIIASEPQYREHLAPLEGLDGPDVTLVASTRDLRQNPGSVYMEHGCGLQWHRGDNLRMIMEHADQVLVPNGFVADMYAKAGQDTDVIGTPKLDAMVQVPYRQHGPVAISFHWSSILRAPILRDYREPIAELAEQVPVIGHGHPRAWPYLERYWSELGIEFVRDFREVWERASVYVCDHSSTLYEWAAADRRLVLMDYPAQKTFPDRSSGLRYDYYSGVGPHVLPSTFVQTVKDTMTWDGFARPRREATEALFPFLGSSVPRTLEVLHG